MRGWQLLLLFTAVPILEVWLLSVITVQIGMLGSLALVVATGVLGSFLARREGAKLWGQWQAAIEAGQVPEIGLAEGLLVFLGGVLLITPGVLTDAVGLILLAPPTRRLIANRLRARMQQRIAAGNVEVRRFGPITVMSGMGGAGGRRPDPQGGFGEVHDGPRLTPRGGGGGGRRGGVIDVDAVEREG